MAMVAIMKVRIILLSRVPMMLPMIAKKFLVG